MSDVNANETGTAVAAEVETTVNFGGTEVTFRKSPRKIVGNDTFLTVYFKNGETQTLEYAALSEDIKQKAMVAGLTTTIFNASNKAKTAEAAVLATKSRIDTLLKGAWESTETSDELLAQALQQLRPEFSINDLLDKVGKMSAEHKKALLDDSQVKAAIRAINKGAQESQIDSLLSAP
jgi:hypothetical protein